MHAPLQAICGALQRTPGDGAGAPPQATSAFSAPANATAVIHSRRELVLNMIVLLCARHAQRPPSTQIGTAPGAAPEQHVVPVHDMHGQVVQLTDGTYARQFPCTHTSSRAQLLPQSPQ